MRPAARLQAAVELLDLILAGTAPADRVVERYFRDRRYAGAKDRRAVAARVFAVLRERAPLAWRFARIWDRPIETALERAAGRDLALVHAAVHAPNDLALFGEDGPHAPAGLTYEERIVADSAPRWNVADAPEWIRLGYPAWLGPSLRRRFGDNLEREMAALNTRAPLDLRAQAGDRDLLVDELREQNLPAAPTPISPWGIRIADAVPLGAIDAFRRGALEVQDEGSQLVAALALPQPGETIIDLCAGAGGKALALASLMDDTGTVIAADVDARRLAELGPRQKRAGLRCIRAQAIAAGAPELNEWNGRADAVIVDSPCTGAGTWRRAPDARWRLTPATLANATALQGELLARAAQLVRPGGRLVYAVCSLLPEEGEDQAAAFRAAHPDFTPVPPARRWDAAGLGRSAPAGDYLLLTPAAQGTDGFFIAVFLRAKG